MTIILKEKCILSLSQQIVDLFCKIKTVLSMIKQLWRLLIEVKQLYNTEHFFAAFLSLSHFMEFILFLKSFPKLFSVCATYCLELGIQIIVPPRGFLHFLGQFGVMTAECYKFTLQNKHLLRLLCSTHLTLETRGSEIFF